MHLLKRLPDGTLQLHEFFGKTKPPYAILSHRWGTDEPTFQDIAEPSSRNSAKAAGLEKLHFCGRQAAKDGLEYFWVDTVCIDKKNSVQLNEAIVSMYRWYAESSRCYVYMSDVEKLDPDFYHSAWFERGWTLQELLAPTIVEFFSASQSLLATKRFLEPQIAAITSIPMRALRGRIHDFTPEERISWGSDRVTTRTEDRAYCLMGIVDVFMPVIYGEGERAFDRLYEEMHKRELMRRMPLPTRQADFRQWKTQMPQRRPTATGAYINHDSAYEYGYGTDASPEQEKKVSREQQAWEDIRDSPETANRNHTENAETSVSPLPSSRAQPPPPTTRRRTFQGTAVRFVDSAWRASPQRSMARMESPPPPSRKA